MDLPAIAPVVNATLAARLRHRIDHLTKPLGALGQLEALAVQLGLILQRDQALAEALGTPQMVVFAADHGLAAEGVSAYPQAVTAQMVMNMAGGGASVNVLARQHGFALTLVDAGVAADLSALPIAHHKIALGTASALRGPAMTQSQAQQALRSGMDVVRARPGRVLALGEMGIGNTSSAALLFATLCGVDIAEACGRGTGLDDAQLSHKRDVLQQVARRHATLTDPLDVLAAVGGFEIAMMAGALLQGASERRVLLIDGFIAGAAALVAHALCPAVSGYLVFCHRSHESGHRLMLQHLLQRDAVLPGAPLLDLDLRLGEGSGALLAWPLVLSAARLFDDMASFESAGVSSAL
jgi:nicotinate-nucleotide--dimethylbenzimidazole phosphoribosyltransferase